MQADANAPFRIEQSHQYEGDDWWTWAVWLDGTAEALDQVEWAEYTLHPTFNNPVRKVTDRLTNFRLESAGWGVFTLFVVVRMRSGETWRLMHDLELYYPDGRQNLA